MSIPSQPRPGDVPPDQPLGPALSPPDAAALDALVDAALESARLSDEHRARADAALRLMRVLDVRAQDLDSARERLVRAVAARLSKAAPHADEAHAPHPPVLCPADDDALEALVSSAFDPRRVAGGMRERAAQHLRLLDLLGKPARDPADASDADADSHSFSRESLIQRTLARVADAAREPRLRLDPAELRRTSGSGRRFRLADAVSVAAALLIGTAVVWPIMGAMRERGRQTSCQGNMAGLGAAFASYASSNKSSLPLATSSQPGTPWWFVGDPQRSNSANLFHLRRERYTDPAMLACAGNRHALTSLPDDARDWPEVASVSYSFQNLFSQARPTYDQAPTMIVLVDRSPVILKAIRGEWFDPEANSPNHAGRGQVMLRMDGSAVWTVTPVTDQGDNVWLPRDLEQAIQEARLRQGRSEAKPLKGTEEPAAADDVFVGP